MLLSVDPATFLTLTIFAAAVWSQVGHPHPADIVGHLFLSYYCLDTLTLKTRRGILRLWIVTLYEGMDNPGRYCTTGAVCQSPMEHPLSFSLCAPTLRT